MIYNIMFLGSPFTGKTVYGNFLTKNEYITTFLATLGSDLHYYVLNEDIHFCIWDVSGAPKYGKMRTIFYNRINGVLLFFSVINEYSIKELEEIWIPEIIENLGLDIPLVLIANMSDLFEKHASSMSKNTIFGHLKNINKTFNREIKIFFTSSKENKNIEEPLLQILTEIKDKAD